MSEPTNSAARNAMTDHERQCYDWGWEDAEERIIALLETEATIYADGLLDPAEVIALIKGEQN